MANREEETVSPVRRNTAGLRDALFDELDWLREGKSSTTKAAATAKLCGSIVESLRVEMEIRKFLYTAPQLASSQNPVLGEPIELGEGE